MNIPVFDLHCDTALALLGRDDRPERKLYENDCHIHENPPTDSFHSSQGM